MPTSAIKAGFYCKLWAREGRNRTFCTGVAFHTHDSSLLWQFTEALLPRITASSTSQSVLVLFFDKADRFAPR